jgi:hypothetical protein
MNRLNAGSRSRGLGRTKNRTAPLLVAMTGVVVIVASGAVAFAQGRGPSQAVVTRPAAPSLPAAKQSVLDAQASARAAAPVLAKPTNTAASANLPPDQLAQAQPPRVGGIFDVHQGPFATSLFQIKNMWSGPVSGVWLVVYAGGPTPPDGSNATQGGVHIITLPLDPNASVQTSTDVGQVTAPGVGPLTVVSVSGTTLSLTDTAGHTVNFDLVARAFTS